jgi:uncharacterized protein YfaS (alpha-2-macroglobulin family)
MMTKCGKSALLPLKAMTAVALATALWGVRGAPRAAGGERPAIEPIGIQAVGQTELLAGAPAAVRVVLTDHREGEPVAAGRVVVRLSPADGEEYDTLFRGLTDDLGTVEASFRVPDVEPGDYDLKVIGRAAAGSDETVQRVRISRRYQVLLTTDKPIYQPSQTMHVRALVLRQPTMKAVAGAEAIFEIKDAKGNKVFKKPVKTNDYGIAATDFILADEVNMGRYAIRCALGDQEAEKTVTVERYVLPKFDVQVTTGKNYYLPGEAVKGTVQADYFYGVPVRGAQVEVSVKTFDVEYTEIATHDGTTDDNGTFEFETELPTSFVGQPVEQGNAFLQFDVKVTSKAEHTEEATATSTVAQDPIRIEALPESGKIVPGVDNVIYVSTTYPDGSPAPCSVHLVGLEDGGKATRIRAQAREADELGLTEFRVQPETSQVTLTVNARTEAGETATRSITLEADEQEEGLLLRLDRHLAEVGDTIGAKVLTAGGVGAVYVDVIKDRQTMLTKAAEIENGQATLRVPVTPELTGSIWLNAYRIQPSGQIIRDTAPVFVDPASDLSIDIAPDKETYRPGEDASVSFAVRDQAGKPVAAALGINVVDESVFALQELKPGMEKVFFYLEQELMKPKVEIHEFDMPIIIAAEPGPERVFDKRERAAKVLMAGAEMPEASTYSVNTYAERVSKLKDGWAEELRPTLEKIQQALQNYREDHEGRGFAERLGVKPLLDGKYLTPKDVQDQWGQDLVFEKQGEGDEEVWMFVVCAIGPDGRQGTEDDMYLSTAWVDRWAADDEALKSNLWGFEGGGRFMAGRGGMAPGMAADFAMGVPMAAAEGAPMAAEPQAASSGAPGTAAGPEPPRIRKYFPETMFSEPSLITGADGKAKLALKMADSITTWRLTALANSASGQLGSTTGGLRCFQDFFVDIDLPVALTQNDEVSIPIVVYNYLKKPQRVRLEMERGDWFTLKGGTVQELTLDPNEVSATYYRIKVKGLGKRTLQVRADGSQMSDAIKRQIEVLPDGKEQNVAYNGRLEGTVAHTVSIPRTAVAGASKIIVRMYPGVFSQVIEGMESMLRLPGG